MNPIIEGSHTSSKVQEKSNILQILFSSKLMIEGFDSCVEKFLMRVFGIILRNGSGQVL